MSRGTGGSVQLGFVAGVHGVKGWVRVHSYTVPRENVVAHRAWTLHQDGSAREVDVTAGQAHGKTVIAKIARIDDRDSAAELIGAAIFIPRSALPDCGPGEYYWADLEGLTVLDPAGNVLGQVDHLIETGAHDVLVLDGNHERLIPFVLDEIVSEVDLEHGTITVTWDAGFWED